MADSLCGDKMEDLVAADADNIPGVVFTDVAKDVLSEPYKEAIIIKVLGKHFSYTALLHRQRSVWRIKGGYHVMNVRYGYLLVKFDVLEDREKNNVYDIEYEYENLQLICEDCNCFGHDTQGCAKKKVTTCVTELNAKNSEASLVNDVRPPVSYVSLLSHVNHDNSIFEFDHIHEVVTHNSGHEDFAGDSNHSNPVTAADQASEGEWTVVGNKGKKIMGSVEMGQKSFEPKKTQGRNKHNGLMARLLPSLVRVGLWATGLGIRSSNPWRCLILLLRSALQLFLTPINGAALHLFRIQRLILAEAKLVWNGMLCRRWCRMKTIVCRCSRVLLMGQAAAPVFLYNKAALSRGWSRVWWPRVMVLVLPAK
ncbi:hypothetical protein PIB30_000527 [Stylosanthes scabra]|uniref:DUF4283 domain-containing protein n=1 Tax=Stylosanthes scabra TaxID=79078 RepID=A0ABU6W0L0_9FABA|nr:hypothetical protein [Stylosanthes scabra]